MATIVVHESVPSPMEDAEAVMNAVKGWGTNEKALFEVLAHRNAAQRQAIRHAYEEHYHEDLIKRLESELPGHLEKAMYRWMLEPLDCDAVLANVALKRHSPDYPVIVELACVKDPEEFLAVKRAYQWRYKHSLEEDVASHSTGDLRKLLFAIASTFKYNGYEIDAHLAKAESHILHELIENKAYNDDEFIRIFATRSNAQLNATFNIFKDDYGISIAKSLLEEPATEYLSALRTVVHCITDPIKYFVKVLRDAIHQHGTDEDTLTRIIVTHAERDLRLIKEKYYERDNITLETAVVRETSGDYETFLLALLGN
ncbi:hypothetical protein C5167_026650 [Papaver somniferum]|uniref:annexin-like protein RJ4 n=1 Tax=Papaver somniferum TaxID=3469 RepID=UPI000E6FF1CA|nr:annexin-like protein RJ4 [Papaver somniferum]RZC85978.1 hypothetical protein C5167_026650 [Papaver somniferum]